MIDRSTPDSQEILRRLRDIDGVVAAMRRGVGIAMREHKLMGRYVVVWQDGKVVKLPPEEIPDYDEDGNLISPPAPKGATDEAAKE